MLKNSIRAHRSHRNYLVPLSVILSIILVFLAFFVFASVNGKMIMEGNQQYLINDSERTAEIISNTISDGYRNISVLSQLIEKSLQSPEVDIAAFQQMISDSVFDFVEYADPNGLNHNITGGTSDASDRTYYLDAMQGHSGMELIFDSRATHENLLMFYAPIRYEGEIVGSLVGVYQAKVRLSNILALDYVDEKGDSFLCTAEGSVIACSHSVDQQHKQNIMEAVDFDDRAAALVGEAMRNKKTVSFQLNETKASGYLLPVPETDWYLVQFFPSAANNLMVRQQNVIGLSLVVVLCVIFLLLLLVIVRNYSRQETLARGALEDARKAENEKNQQLQIMMSIAGIYYSMHIIDLSDYSFTEYASHNEVKQIVGTDDTHNASVVLPKVMHATMSDEALQEALEFTQIDTLAKRMVGKKTIFKDFRGKNVGWIRLAFITIQADEKGFPERVIITTQIVDAEKNREAQLILASSVDKLTGCLNRKAYEDDLATYPKIPPEADFVFIMNDINGLKEINDTRGHEAGDELIHGAAECMKRCIGNYGRVYRIGGDEFAAIIFADELTLKAIMTDFEEAQTKWRGKYSSGISVSTGYATKREFPTWTTRDIAAVADRRMYEDKERYYQEVGHNRRIRQTAHASLIAMYSKILKVDLTNDIYQIINMDTAEQKMSMGFSPTFSEWVRGFGLSGQVHPEDLSVYLEQTELSRIRDYFHADKQSLAFQYRRRYGDEFKYVAMEMIPADDYSNDKQSVFLFVKKVDK